MMNFCVHFSAFRLVGMFADLVMYLCLVLFSWSFRALSSSLLLIRVEYLIIHFSSVLEILFAYEISSQFSFRISVTWCHGGYFCLRIILVTFYNLCLLRARPSSEICIWRHWPWNWSAKMVFASDWCATGFTRFHKWCSTAHRFGCVRKYFVWSTGVQNS